jgi:hypothetical protein
MYVALFAVAGVLAVLLGLLWLVRRPPAGPAAAGGVTLRYRLFVPAVGALGAVLVPVALVAILLFAASQQQLNAEAYEAVGWMLVGFQLVGGPLLLVGSHTRVFVSDDGVTKYSPFWGTTSLRWEEVTRLDYSLSGRYTIVRGEGGRALRVSDYMDGTEVLAAAFQNHRAIRMGWRGRAAPDGGR